MGIVRCARVRVTVEAAMGFIEELVERATHDPDLKSAIEGMGQKILAGGPEGAEQLVTLAKKIGAQMPSDPTGTETFLSKFLIAVPIEDRDGIIRYLDHKSLVRLVQFLLMKVQFMEKEFGELP